MRMSIDQTVEVFSEAFRKIEQINPAWKLDQWAKINQTKKWDCVTVVNQERDTSISLTVYYKKFFFNLVPDTTMVAITYRGQGSYGKIKWPIGEVELWNYPQFVQFLKTSA